MRQFCHHVLRGFRLLIKNPVFSIVAILTIALGIGANTAIFSIVNAVLLRPLPYVHSRRLVALWEFQRKATHVPASYPDFEDWKKQQNVFEALAAYENYDTFTLVQNGRPETIQSAAVTPEFFRVLGLNPIIGRDFAQSEAELGHDRVAIISYNFWQRHLGRKTHVIGEHLQLENQSFAIVGVLPPSFWFPEMNEDVWVPLSPDPTNLSGEDFQRRDSHWVKVIGRLKPGITVKEANAEMSAIADRLQHQYPQTNSGVGIAVTPLREGILGDARPQLLVLLVAVGFILLIACVNVANLLLAKASSRRKEIAVRFSLGASRIQVIGQLIGESAPISILGGAAALVFAFWGMRLIQILGPSDIPRLHQATIDLTVLGFTLVVSIATAVLFGIVPALVSSKTDLVTALKESDRGSSAGTGTLHAQSLLIVCEVAAAMVLLVAAGLLVTSLFHLSGSDPGFKWRNLISTEINLPVTQYHDPQTQSVFWVDLLDRIRAIPGVASAATVNYLPFGGLHDAAPFVIGQTPASQLWNSPSCEVRVVSVNYFHTMGIHLLKGRDFTTSDSSRSPRVAIISDTFANRFFPRQSPVGERLRSAEWPTDVLEIVGVVTNVKQWTLSETPRPYLYVPESQAPQDSMFLIARSAVKPDALVTAIGSTVSALDPRLPITDTKTMRERLDASLDSPRFDTFLFGTFAGLALVLAAIGLAGMVSYAVVRRTHEIGIRLALGAQRRDVLYLIVGHAVKLQLIGLAIGSAISFAVDRALASSLYGVQTTDPLNFLGVASILLIVGTVASYLPARRAARVNPIIALRYE
jgi:putative ABC transport system permease protein